MPDNKQEELKETQTNKKDKTKNKIEELQAQIEKLKSDNSHWQNEYYRAFADMKNLRSRIEKDYKEALKYRSEGFIEALLPTLDSFQSVLQNEPEDPTLKNYLIGFQFVYKNLITVLESEGVSVIAPKIGDTFDSNEMEAYDTIESEKENIITKIYANGYKLHDKLIRPARVQVGIIKEEKKTDA